MNGVRRVNISEVNRHQCWYEDENGEYALIPWYEYEFLLHTRDDWKNTLDDLYETLEATYRRHDDLG